MSDVSFQGLLFIGDPHLASRIPGFRLDDFPRVALGKLRWCLEYAAEHSLLPVLLGDLFHWPRDNANWLLAELMVTLPPQTLTVMGNHDCREDVLGEDDSLTILVRAGRLRLLDGEGAWRGMINGVPVAIGGTSWGQPLPKGVPWEGDDAPRWTFWVTHHDLGFPGYVAADPSLKLHEIPGIDVVVNGHIHERLTSVTCGQTAWLNPGNITRLTRDKTDLRRRPAAMAVYVQGDEWRHEPVVVPHGHARDVFAPIEAQPQAELWTSHSSDFVQGLRELLARRTQSGAGLKHFLEQNLIDLNVDDRVATEIRELAKEVLPDDDTALTTGHGDAAQTLREAQPPENQG